jgi:hypothetical protein
LNSWCDFADAPIGNHNIHVITARPAHTAIGVQLTAAAAQAHYATEERIARALTRLGKTVAAAMITDLFPKTPQILSGDLGEIYTTEWINAHIGDRAPIKRLRRRDHRNMAMRGDDVIGMILDPATQRLQVNKRQASSRAMDKLDVATSACCIGEEPIKLKKLHTQKKRLISSYLRAKMTSSMVAKVLGSVT